MKVSLLSVLIGGKFVLSVLIDGKFVLSRGKGEDHGVKSRTTPNLPLGRPQSASPVSNRFPYFQCIMFLMLKTLKSWLLDKSSTICC